MQMLNCSAVFSATYVSNRICPFFAYQEKEPASVRKLRKF